MCTFYRMYPNPKGTMQDFNIFWDSVQQEKDNLQVAFIPL